MDLTHPKTNARLMLFVGGLFLAAAAVGLMAKQYAFLGFFGVGAVYIALGTSKLRKQGPTKE